MNSIWFKLEMIAYSSEFIWFRNLLDAYLEKKCFFNTFCLIVLEEIMSQGWGRG